MLPAAQFPASNIHQQMDKGKGVGTHSGQCSTGERTKTVQSMSYSVIDVYGGLWVASMRVVKMDLQARDKLTENIFSVLFLEALSVISDSFQWFLHKACRQKTKQDPVTLT